LVVAAVVAFAIAFVAARAIAGDDAAQVSAPVPRSHAPVAIDNLERPPAIKPLRSAPGAPPAPAASTSPAAPPETPQP
jgi:hypothetical protein